MATVSNCVIASNGQLSYGRTAGVAECLFLLGVFLAPLELPVVASLTVHDVAVLCVLLLLALRSERLYSLPRRVLVAFYVFLLFALLSTLRSPFPVESLTQILQFAFIFLVHIPVVVTVTRSKSVLNSALILFLLGSLAGVVWSFVTREVQGAGRVVTLYSDNPNRLGYPTAYLLPFLLYYVSSGKRRSAVLGRAIVVLPVLFLLVWALGASGSRSSTLGALVGVVVFLSFRPGGLRGRQIVKKGLATAVLIAGAAYLLTQTELVPTTLRDRVTRTLNQESSLVDDRTSLAIAGVRAFVDSPFIGIGLDNFRYVAPDFEPAATNQLPHNLWIQFLAQVGIIGTLMFLYVIADWMAMLYRARKRMAGEPGRELLWAFVAAMSAVMTIYLFLPIMIQRQYWLLFGLGIAAARLAVPSERSEAATTVEPGFPVNAGQAVPVPTD